MLSGVGLLVAGCGAESGRAGAPAGAVPGDHEGPPVVNPLPSCVPARGAGNGGCPSVHIAIDPTITSPACDPGGYTVEPLAVPDLSDGMFDPSTATAPERDAAKWDRSALPEGALVVRLHGLNASCYPGGGLFFPGDCSESSEPRVVPPSFYEQHCGEAGGCSTSEKHPLSASIESDGFWWYLNDRGESALDVVVCAPEVSSYSAGGCLSLDPERSCDP